MYKLIITTLSLLLFACISVLPAFSQGARLVAPEPPEAVEIQASKLHDRPSGGSDGFTMVFFTPLSVEEALSFYTKHVGDMQEVDAGSEYRADLMEINFKKSGVLKVYDIPRRPGVTVKSVRTLERRSCTSEFFGQFRKMSNALDQYSRQDVNNLCKQYGYLELAHYGYSDKRGIDGKQYTNDEVLYREYLKELDKDAGKVMSAEEKTAKAQRLMQQGKMDEARALFEEAAQMQMEGQQQIMQQIQTGKRTAEDNWDEWLEFLKELDTMIYPTVVFIDIHPSDWPDDEWIHESIEW